MSGRDEPIRLTRRKAVLIVAALVCAFGNGATAARMPLGVAIGLALFTVGLLATTQIYWLRGLVSLSYWRGRVDSYRGTGPKP